ncbi:mitogen-activated protein kinase 4-like [Curcuma longa]|uniref:mitogen-activated protein kinase 4-like n=1 Tax=Curcuma longa TaxID=136217 RepID=UPI003D9F4146
MAMVAHPPPGFKNEGKSYYTIWRTVFEIDTKYVPIEPIGRGAYGVVCSSIIRETEEKVAIKKIKNVFENPIRPLRILREIKLLRQLKHDNIIALKDVMVPPNRRSFRDVYLVFELMDTDLYEIIQSRQPLSDYHCRYFLFQLLRGLKYIHSANVIHRDLKPENLFVNGDCKLKIGDFGLARSMSQSGRGMSSYVATLWYRAPELLVGSDRYDASVDMWSVGCILAELLGRRPLFPGTDDINQLERIVHVLGVQGDADLHFIDSERARKYIKSLPQSLGVPFASIYPNANPLAIDLLEKMLVFDPSKRIDVTEALQHPYMASIYDPLLDPAADGPVDLGFDDDVEEDAIREMMWEEMLFYHQQGEVASRA